MRMAGYFLDDSISKSERFEWQIRFDHIEELLVSLFTNGKVMGNGKKITGFNCPKLPALL